VENGSTEDVQHDVTVGDSRCREMKDVAWREFVYHVILEPVDLSFT